MGFCRHCGNIVAGARCSCGGTSVAPVVSFNRTGTPVNQDKWSKTYVSSERSGTPPTRVLESSNVSNSKGASVSTSSNATPTFPSRRFPRPKSTSVTPSMTLKSGVSDHIIYATTSPRPPSPLKLSTTFSDTENDILPSFLPHEPTLSKVYGSVLQPKDSLTLHSCAVCTVVFPPDATIYPNPSSSDKQTFICKQCFTECGGSKGTCPSCSRPVLALKSEGAYVQSGGSYWHKRCYNCAGCFKNIGDTPMVDLLGRPSCVDCFDNCLKRDHPTTPKKNRVTSKSNSPSFSNPGGMNASYGPGRRSRESSPTLEELEQRLGLAKSRESSPHPIDNPRSSTSKKFTDTTNKLALRQHSTNARSSETSQQDIFGVGSRTPITESPTSRKRPVDIFNTAHIPDKPSGSFCEKCGKGILNGRDGGKFVTIPPSDEISKARIYHAECFTCTICEKPFNDSGQGPTSFVMTKRGQCHVECAPSQPVIIQKGSSPKYLPDWAPTIPQDLPTWTSKKLNASMLPPLMGRADEDRSTTPSTSPSKQAFPRFGGQTSCPGCHKAVSLMERGVVPGPQGSKWHASCLVCGGKKETTRAALLGRVRDDAKKTEPGCGKKLDSAAKIDGEGGVWCRECLLFVGVGGSPHTSPTKPPTKTPRPASIYVPGKINPQLTGTTTLARQFTGIGANDPILRQLTGGGLSPTRSISPTKQLGLNGMGGGLRPRPKSMMGSVRHTKSVDEGRGMYLVRQMTGTTSGGS